MDQRLSLVTLGVADLERSRRFYAALGWTEKQPAHPEVAFFQMPGMGLALHSRVLLAEEIGVAPGRGGAGGFSGVTLSVNGRDRAEVDAMIVEALAAGATSLRAPAPTEWGGYTGYVADPDGHVLEFCHNPEAVIGADGSTTF